MNGSVPSPIAPEPSVTLRDRFGAWWEGLKAYFTEQDPKFWTAFAPAFVLSVFIFVRSPLSNYIFDEQEALLANPYVNGQAGGFLHAFTRDFWGLPPDRSIGSYRPLPDLVWRALWFVSHRPFLHHWVNVLMHAINASLVAGFVLALSRRRDTAWLAGACFLACAVLTEAITGVVGIADVFGGLFVLGALCLLRLDFGEGGPRVALSLLVMPCAVFGAILLGLFSKESVLVALPLVPWVALLSAPILHPKRPLRALRAVLAFVGSAAALVAYTYFRRRFFPITTAVDSGSALSANQSALARGLSAFLHWFQQPQLPHDPVNNPLVDADLPHRIAGALRVYARGIGQLVFPWTLSGDYSAPQEPIPDRIFFPESIIGAILLILPPLIGISLWLTSLFREFRPAHANVHVNVHVHVNDSPFSLSSSSSSSSSSSPPAPPPYTPSYSQRALILLAIGLVWLPVAYFPHSNIPVLLPTIRAERFWYLPAFGSACILAVLFTRLLRDWQRWGVIVVSAFLGFQALAARWHALDYTDDLIFWRATHYAVPRSAKAQLNYSVMLGARGQLEERLKINAEAMRLAPNWPMAHVYYGDTLCRLKRAEQAWPHYLRGFELAPNDLNLIALGLQCAWEEKIIEAHKDELIALSDAHPGSWLAYLGSDLVYNGAANGGVQKKYRPRAYDEGPKSDASQ